MTLTKLRAFGIASLLALGVFVTLPQSAQAQWGYGYGWHHHHHHHMWGGGCRWVDQRVWHHHHWVWRQVRICR